MRRASRIALLTAACVVALGGLAFAGVRTGVLPSPLGQDAAKRKVKPIRVRLSPATVRLRANTTVRVRIAIAGRRWPRTGGTRARNSALASAAALPRRAKVRLTVARPLPRGVTFSFRPRITATRRATLTIRAGSTVPAGLQTVRIVATRVRPKGAPVLRASARLRAVFPAAAVTPTGEPAPAATATPTTTTPPTLVPRLLVGGDLKVSLGPGLLRGVDVKLGNPFEEALDVTSIELEIDGINAPNATPDLPCDRRDFVVAPMTGDPIRIPAQKVTSLSEIGVPGNLWPSIAMLDRPVNQDGCKGAAITFHYRAEARSTGP